MSRVNHNGNYTCCWMTITLHIHNLWDMRNQLEVLKNDHGKSKRKSEKDQGNNEKN